MTEDEMFKKAWLFVFEKVGENLGFDVKPVHKTEEDERPEETPA